MRRGPSGSRELCRLELRSVIAELPLPCVGMERQRRSRRRIRSTSVVHPVPPMPTVYGLGILIPSVGLAIQGQDEKNQHRKYYGHNNKLY